MGFLWQGRQQLAHYVNVMQVIGLVINISLGWRVSFVIVILSPFLYFTMQVHSMASKDTGSLIICRVGINSGFVMLSRSDAIPCWTYERVTSPRSATSGIDEWEGHENDNDNDTDTSE